MHMKSRRRTRSQHASMDKVTAVPSEEEESVKKWKAESLVHDMLCLKLFSSLCHLDSVEGRVETRHVKENITR